MKKITSVEPISFRVDGNTLLEITSEGVLTDEASASFAKEKLGEHITVVDVGLEDALAEAQDALKEPKLPELKEKANGYGLPVSGTKDELSARIAEHEKTLAEAQDALVTTEPAA